MCLCVGPHGSGNTHIILDPTACAAASSFSSLPGAPPGPSRPRRRRGRRRLFPARQRQLFRHRAGVAGLATSGDPKAGPVCGRWPTAACSTARTTRRRHQGRRGPRRCPHRRAVSPDGFKPVRVNNRVRRAIDAALGTLNLLAPDAATRRNAADAVFKARDAAALPALDAALARESDAGVKRSCRRPAPPRSWRSPARPRSTGSPPSTHPGPRRFGGARHPARPRDRSRPERARRRRPRRVQHRDPPGADGERPERLVRRLARLGAAARGHRPCHHLRGDGHHQHGARRDGDARRLHHLPGAGADPPEGLACSTGRCRSRSRSPSWPPAPSAS